MGDEKRKTPWTLGFDGYMPHGLYTIARKAAPEYAEKWRDDIMATYQGEPDGEGGDMGGYASIDIHTLKELSVALKAFSEVGPLLACHLTTESVYAGATLNHAWGAEAYVRSAHQGQLRDAVASAVKLLGAALLGEDQPEAATGG